MSPGPGGGGLKQIKLIQSKKKALNSSSSNVPKRKLLASALSTGTSKSLGGSKRIRFTEPNTNVLNSSRKLPNSFDSQSKSHGHLQDEVQTSLSQKATSLAPQCGKNLEYSRSSPSGAQLHGDSGTSPIDNIITNTGSKSTRQDNDSDSRPNFVPTGPSDNGYETSNNEIAARSTNSRKKRGVGKGCKLDKEVKMNGKYKIVFPPGEKYPVKYESEFADGIGVVIKNYAEIQGVSHWRKVPVENKEVCFARLLQWYDIEGWPVDERVIMIVYSRLQTAYTRWRSTLHKEYKKLVLDGIEPREVCPREDLNMEKWQAACDFIEDETFQKKSQTNSINRSKMPFNHTSGKTAMLTRYRKMVNKCKITLWKDTHIKKNSGGQFVNSEAQAVHEAMVSKQSQHVDEDGEPPSEDAILVSMLGHRPGYIKGMGHGVEVVRGRRSSTSLMIDNDELKKAKDTIQEQGKTLEEQRMRMDAQVKEMEALKVQMAKMQEILCQPRVMSALSPNNFPTPDFTMTDSPM